MSKESGSAKKAGISAGIYLFSGILNRSIPFLLLPVLTSYLSTEEFGTWSVFQVCFTFILPFVRMSCGVQISKDYFNVSNEEIGKKIFNLLLLFIIIGIGLSAIFYGYLSVFNSPIDLTSPKLLVLIPLIGIGNSIHQSNLTVLRNRQKAVQFGVYEILYTAINLLVALYFVKYSDYGWISMVFGISSASVSLGIIGFITLYVTKKIKLEADRKKIASLFSFGLALIPHALSTTVISLSDRLFIDYYVDKSTVGLYTVAYTFSMLLTLFSESFVKAWTPWLYSKMANITEAKKSTIVKYSYAYFVTILVGCFVVYLIVPYLIEYMVDESYYGAKSYVLYIVLGLGFNAMYIIVFPYSAYLGKTKVLSMFMFFIAFLNLVLNYILVPKYGAIGAAIATSIVYGLKFIFTFIYTNKIYSMPWFKSIR